MDTTKNGSDILHDFSPLLLMYKDGRIKRLPESPPITASLDPTTGVESKDITISQETGVAVRLYKPNVDQNPKNKKLPLLVYFHGGGFCIESTFSPLYHNYLNSLASQAQILVVSVEYRLAPEHLLPIAFDDCWDALSWVFTHTSSTPAGSSGTEPWLLENADFSRVYLAGDSAGGTITHHMAMRIGNQGLAGGSIHSINGIILFHPYFWGKDRIGDEVTKLNTQPVPDLPNKIWLMFYPESSGLDDPGINPANDPSLSRLGCERVLIFVAEKDFLRDRGVLYKELLEKSGWQGKAELVESLGESHVFHLFYPSCENAEAVMKKVVSFLNPAAQDTEN